jgi:hypothetical protein
VDVPPIAYSGEIRTDIRASLPEDEEHRLQQLRTAQIDAVTFIWQPWFATLHGNFALSHASNENLEFFQSSGKREQDSTSLFASGRGTVTVFPVSRFPFEGFVEISDSHTDFDDPLGPEISDFQTLRFGARQQYQPESGRSSYIARVERSLQTDVFGQEGTTDLLQLSTTQNFTKHRFGVDLNIESASLDEEDADRLNVVLTGRHNYRPGDTLSVDSFATVTDLNQETALLENDISRADIRSFAIWRPRDWPLTVDADARLTADRTESFGESTDTYTQFLRLGADYEFSERLRLLGNAGVTFIQAGEDETSTFQDLTATYRSESIPLRGFTYSYVASAGASNRTESEEDAVQRYSLSAGHAINRTFPLTEQTFTFLQFDQNGSATHDTDEGDEQTLNHTGSLSFNRASASGTSNLRLVLTDSRTFGEPNAFGADDTAFQVASLQGTHVQNLSRYASWNANFSLVATRTTAGDEDETFNSSNANLVYQHGRLFGFRRLRFRSELELSSGSLFFLPEENDETSEVSWQNDIDYTIGRLDVNFKGRFTDRGGRSDFGLFLTIRRRFDGRVFGN